MKKKFSGPSHTNSFVFVYIDESFASREVLSSEISDLDLNVAEDACFYFLRYGFVPPPLTIYSNLVCLPVGLDLEVDQDKKSIHFSNNFRFVAKNSHEKSVPDLQVLRLKIQESVEKTLSSDTCNILLQSGGKDSTVLVEALSHFKGKYNLKCMTYEADFRDRESYVAQSISKHYGLNHETIRPDYELEFSLLKKHYSMNNALLSADCTLPAYLHLLSSSTNSNVIDGLGNDMYMGYIGTKIEAFLKYFNLSRFQKFEPSKLTNSEYVNYGISTIFMTSEERMFPGTKLSVREISKLTTLPLVSDFSRFISAIARNYDLDDSKASVRARFCDLGLFQMKGLQSAMCTGNTINFPFGNQGIFEYYFGLPKELRYSKKKRVNKIFLRSLINTFDVDKTYINRKSGFRYNMESFISSNAEEINNILKESKFLFSGLQDFLDAHLGKLNYISAAKIYILLSFALWFESNSSKKRVKSHLVSGFFLSDLQN